MSNYLLGKTKYDVDDIIPIFSATLNDWYNWTVREKEWYPLNHDYIYLMTRPGHERWFSRAYLRIQISNYYERNKG